MEIPRVTQCSGDRTLIGKPPTGRRNGVLTVNYGRYSEGQTNLKGYSHALTNQRSCLRTVRLLVYPGSYVEYVQKMGHEAPGIFS